MIQEAAGTRNAHNHGEAEVKRLLTRSLEAFQYHTPGHHSITWKYKKPNRGRNGIRHQ